MTLPNLNPIRINTISGPWPKIATAEPTVFLYTRTIENLHEKDAFNI